MTDSAFDRVVAAVDPALYVVTVAAGDDRDGCLIGFGSQVSIDPPRFLACLSTSNRTYRVAQGARTVVVHALSADQRELAKLFGGETGDEVDKFAQCAWTAGADGTPVLDGCPLWFAGRILERHELGDHVGFLLEPIETQAPIEHPEGYQALRLSHARDIEAGHAP